MLWNDHWRLAGKHAFLSASKPSWINYDDEKLDRTFLNSEAARKGTELHDLAKKCIELGVKVRSPKTIAMYVNDAIGYRMTPEQLLYYSDNAFGTADAISFRRGQLRIHDLKTGVNPSSVHQLEIYAAFFCLEYRMKPQEIGIELRIYQSDEVEIFEPDPHDILVIMERVVSFDKRIEAIKAEALV